MGAPGGRAGEKGLAMNTTTPAASVSRRRFLGLLVRGLALAGLATLTARLGRRAIRQRMVWQIDPHACTACGQCATNCVRARSAVKCVHAFPMCGYCELCTGFFEPEPLALNAGAENQLCPMGAIRRRFVEDPYHEYTIDETLCVGCAKCVKGCGQFGNGSLYLQVRHDLCLHCNECAIARACPARAFRRVPADRPYLFKDQPVPGTGGEPS